MNYIVNDTNKELVGNILKGNTKEEVLNLSFTHCQVNMIYLKRLLSSESVNITEVISFIDICLKDYQEIRDIVNNGEDLE